MVWTRSERIRYAAEGRLTIKIAEVQEWIFGLLDYDVDLLVIEYQFEGLDWMGRELEYGRHFYEELFGEVIVEPLARKEAVRLIAEEEIELEYVRIAGGKLISSRLEFESSKVDHLVTRVKDALIRLHDWHLVNYSSSSQLQNMGESSQGNMSSDHCDSDDDDDMSLAEDFQKHLEEEDNLVNKSEVERYLAESCSGGQICIHLLWRIEVIPPKDVGDWVFKDLLELVVFFLIKARRRRMKFNSHFVFSVEGEEFCVGSNVICRVVVDMETSTVNEESTSGRSAESENVESEKEDERDDEEPIELLCRIVKQCPTSKVKRKKSLLDIVGQEGIELEVVLKELHISRKKRANNKSEKVQKSQATRLMTGVGGNKEGGADGQRRVVLPKASEVDFADVPESTTSSKLIQAFLKKRMLKRGSTSGTTGKDRLGEEDELKVVEDRENLAIRNGEEEMSKMATRLMKGVCLRMEEEKAKLKKGKAEPKNKVDHLKIKLAREGKRFDSVKAVRKGKISELAAKAGKNLEVVELKEMCLIIKELENELAKEKDASTSLLSSQAELQVELESAHLSEEETRQCSQEFTAEFDRMREANEDREDHRVKVHFKFIEATQTVDDLTRKILEKNAEISKGHKELAETKEKAAKLKSQNDALMVKSKEADMARYCIQALEILEKELRRFVASLKDQITSKTNEQKQTRADLGNSMSELEQLKNKITEKDNELKKV
ncbi:hypothetical protein GIB67_023262 [Kingdonia uniflora]|uniref:Uncharacterized protein n=1 Tax=Kingdonia uniflora TaxID=39325 RepID=A0A7J7LJS0_9MAGN|nr:hypothetical protein GIB67_023262 [Kingdonia uniflora]